MENRHLLFGSIIFIPIFILIIIISNLSFIAFQFNNGYVWSGISIPAGKHICLKDPYKIYDYKNFNDLENNNLICNEIEYILFELFQGFDSGFYLSFFIITSTIFSVIVYGLFRLFKLDNNDNFKKKVYFIIIYLIILLLIIFLYILFIIQRHL